MKVTVKPQAAGRPPGPGEGTPQSIALGGGGSLRPHGLSSLPHVPRPMSRLLPARGVGFTPRAADSLDF